MTQDYEFSQRTEWEFGENELSLALTKRRESGEKIIDLTESNPTRCGFDYPHEIFLKALLDPRNLHYQPVSKGLLEPRQALADYYAAKGVTVDPEHLVLTSSTSEAYSFLFRLLFNPGDVVLIPAPSYPLFSYLAGLSDVEVENYKLLLHNGRWRMDFASIESAVTPFTKAIVLVSPNNPTGSCIKRHELAQLNEICRRHKLAIICDEVFTDYLHDRSPEILQTLAANKVVPTFVVSGLSKALALPQMKLSWILVNGPDDFVKPCLERLDVIADTFLSVNTPVQNACSAWLKDGETIRAQLRARVEANLRFISGHAASLDLQILMPEGGWYAVIHAPQVTDSEKIALELITRHNVFLHPGYFYDFPAEGFFVISLLPSEDDFQTGFRRFLDVIGKK